MDYTADFIGVVKRTLTPEDIRIFERHMVNDQPWFELADNRGRFWHRVYSIQARVGLALIEARLHPLDEYFSEGGRRHENHLQYRPVRRVLSREWCSE